MTDYLPDILISSDARPWLIHALAGAVRRMPDPTAAAPPAAVALARVVLRGPEREALDAHLAEWGDWGTETHLLRVLVGQASAASEPPPAVTWTLPTTAYALDSLICDLTCMPNWGVVADAYVAAKLAVLLSEVAPAGSPVGQMVTVALARAGERLTIGDAVALAAVGHAAVVWSAQPMIYGTTEW